MENANLLTLDDVKELKRFMNLYSANSLDRVKAMKELLTAKNPFDIEKIETTGTPNNGRKVITELFNSVGLHIDFEEDKTE